MSAVADPAVTPSTGPSLRDEPQHSANPRAPKLSRDFWILYVSSFVIDLGLCLYFFMFSLFLVEHRFQEQAIGLITATFTLGTLAGIAPASMLARRLGLRPMMLAFVSLAPVTFALRTFFLQMPLQIVLALLAGAAASIWSVCFSPALAKLTTSRNRAFAFSLFVATGIASGAIGGVAGGSLPGVLHRLRFDSPNVDVARVALLTASATIAIAALPLMMLRIGGHAPARDKGAILTRFLIRFLIAAAVWNFSLSFFAPFANVFLAKHLGLSFSRIGAIYSISQVLQIVAVMAAPLLYRRVGLVAGIALTQVTTGGVLLLLASLSGAQRSAYLYLLLASLQWMGGPGLSSLLMNKTAEAQRSHAAALQNAVNLCGQAASTAAAGWMFQRFGYAGPLTANGLLAMFAATLLFSLLREEGKNEQQELEAV